MFPSCGCHKSQTPTWASNTAAGKSHHNLIAIRHSERGPPMTTFKSGDQARKSSSDFENAGLSKKQASKNDERRTSSRRRTKRLLLEYRKSNDPSVREDICKEYSGVVRFYARKYAESGMDYDDLYQEGCLGLMAALERFDPSLGFEFITYASYFVKGYMREFYRTKAWPCSVPRSMRDMSFQIRLLANQLGHDPSRQEVLDFCDIPPEKVDDAITASQVWRPVCFHNAEAACDVNPKIHSDASRMDTELEDVPLRIDIRSLMEEVLKPEELQIVCMRFFDDLPQREIAQRLGTNQMHVSRTLQRSVQKLEEAYAC